MSGHWHVVAHASELANEGDFVCLPIGDREIAVTRQRGELFAFDNRCGHRGARIFTELRGNQPAVCAYHGRCANSGNVRVLPHMADGGWLFVADSQDAETPSLQPDNDESATLRHVGTLSFVMDCDWRVAVENALDFEHVAHVHADSLARLDLTPGRMTLAPDGNSSQEFVSGRAKALDRVAAQFETPEAFDYIHTHIFPYTAMSSTRGLTVSLQHYLPRTDGKTLFLHRLYVAPAKRDVTAYIAGVAVVNERTFREDAEICARVPADHWGHLGVREERIAHFREHYLHFNRGANA